jgi:hypothetical protein
MSRTITNNIIAINGVNTPAVQAEEDSGSWHETNLGRCKQIFKPLQLFAQVLHSVTKHITRTNAVPEQKKSDSQYPQKGQTHQKVNAILNIPMRKQPLKPKKSATNECINSLLNATNECQQPTQWSSNSICP